MARFRSLGLVWLPLFAAGCSAHAPDNLNAFVADLGNPSAEHRESAERELRRLAPSRYEDLERLLTLSSDLEIRERLTPIVDSLRIRMSAAWARVKGTRSASLVLGERWFRFIRQGNCVGYKRCALALTGQEPSADIAFSREFAFLDMGRLGGYVSAKAQWEATYSQDFVLRHARFSMVINGSRKRYESKPGPDGLVETKCLEGTDVEKSESTARDPEILPEELLLYMLPALAKAGLLQRPLPFKAECSSAEEPIPLRLQTSPTNPGHIQLLRANDSSIYAEATLSPNGNLGVSYDLIEQKLEEIGTEEGRRLQKEYSSLDEPRP